MLVGPISLVARGLPSPPGCQRRLGFMVKAHDCIFEVARAPIRAQALIPSGGGCRPPCDRSACGGRSAAAINRCTATGFILWTCGFHYRGVICKWLSIVYNNPT